MDGMDSQSDEMSSYLSKKTGKIVMISEHEFSTAESEESLEDLSDWEREAVETARAILESNEYIALPSKWDIHEYRLMERFCLSREDEQISEMLYRAIKGRGAFGRFKSATHRFNITDEWYQYREDAFKRIAINWCEENEIEFVDDREPDEGGQKPQRLSREVIYESPWVNLFVDEVRFPDGKIVKKHVVLDFEQEAAGAIVENENKEILLIQSYRYTMDTIEWEIPAGGIEKDESVIEAARRETLEETGYEVEDLEPIYTYNPMIGMSNKIFHIVKCRALRRSGEFDRNEVKAVKWCSMDEIVKMIEEKKIKDGLSLTALLLHLQEAR